MPKMQVLFILASVAYVSAIFLFAGSSVVSDLSCFNPYSLLHIPLYGVLAILLILSIIPIDRMGRSISHHQWRTSSLVSGSIGFAVAITDEYHQSFLFNRTASLSDVFLDLVGIVLFLFIFRRYQLRCQKQPTLLP